MRQISAVLVVVCISAVLHAQGVPVPAPPATPVRPVVDDYFGVKVTDPYRYLENMSDPKVVEWFKAQGDYAEKYLAALPTRSAFVADITKYVNSEPAVISDLFGTAGGRYFFLKRLPDQETAKLYTRENLAAKDQLLVDADRFAGPHGEPPAINFFAPSHDGRYVAMGISVGGSEDAVIHILDASTGKELAETIDRAEFGGVQWRLDNHSFYFCRLQKLDAGASELEKYLKSAVYLHELGTSADADRKIMQMGMSDRIAMDAVDNPYLELDPTSDYVIGCVGHGTQGEQTLYVAPLAALDPPNISWVKLCDVDDQIDQMAFHGDDVFLMSHKDAPRFKILKTNFKKPDVAHATVLALPEDGIVRWFTCAGDALYVKQSRGAVSHLFRIPYDSTTANEIPLPFDGDVYICDSDSRVPGVLFTIASWTKGERICRYDPATNQVTTTDLKPAGPNDNRDDITSVEVRVPSYDGAMVPLSITYKKGIKLDGSNPLILMAYGAYGMEMNARFNTGNLAWLDRGGISCVAHVRGGGELGQDWYKAGYKLTKPNTWRNLIACAKYVIDQKYTTAGRIGITGGSAGGITMSRAITERPDLFAAADIRVGCCNTLRMENTPNGPPNIAEFGSTQTQEGFEDSYAMDGLQHVRDQVAYPAVLMRTGMNDPRVAPWQPGKFAARLQAASSSGKPVILRVDFQAGHGIGASKQQRIDAMADMFAFFLASFAKEGANVQAGGGMPPNGPPGK